MRMLKILMVLLVSFLVLGCTPAEVSVEIKTIPDKAYVSEEVLGKEWITDTTLKLPRKEDGFYNFIIKKDGYKEELVSVNADIKSSVILKKLVKLSTTFEFLVEPHGSVTKLKCENYNVSVNKKIMIPLELFSGEDSLQCKIEASFDGYKTLNKDIVIKKYSNNIIHEVLEENDALLEIGSNPSYVDVYEKHLGYIGTTPLVYKLKANKMQNISSYVEEGKAKKTRLSLEFKKNGYRALKKAVWIEKNKIEKINVNMVKGN